MDDGSETCCSAAQNLQSTRAITSQPLKEKNLFWQTITKRERRMTSTTFDGRQILRATLTESSRGLPEAGHREDEDY